ncbi:MAG: N-6 DNA methylase [Bryobacterales bacterium]|nr:N-6 DNA methylase [Bryobacterales bacterium]
MAEFQQSIPGLATALRRHIDDAHTRIPRFQQAFAEFLTVCRASLHPELTPAQVDEMLIQHLLTERLMRNLFQNPEFTTSNVIAAQVEKVIDALASGSFSKSQFLQKLDRYYDAIEREGRNLEHFSEKQIFLNSVYERFFQSFSPSTADTHGIVYTPPEIVDYMCASVEDALRDEFGLSLESPEVVILDPCTGTGNFIVNLIRRIPPRALAEAYEHRLFANEVMLLPYYVASLNIEHAYFEKMGGGYKAFDGLCFVDTLDLLEHKQIDMFAPDNTKRVQVQKDAAITVIIGNPPYNVGQKSENDNNKNRKYKFVDQRIRDTYAKDSQATNKNSLSDMYVKFFRWAADRLGNRDGIVCYVSNNSFVDQIAFDGMRKHLLQDFDHIDHIDLHGNVRRNPKISGTSHNVFGIQVGVGVTIAVKKRGAPKRLRYHRVPEMWRKGEKLEFLADSQVPWESLTPDAEHTWLIPEHADEYRNYLRLDALFDLYTVGVKTNRDDVVYDWDRDALGDRIARFVDHYNAEIHRHQANPDADWPSHVKWSETLKKNALRAQPAAYESTNLRAALYRPFTHQWLYFDKLLIERVYQWPSVEGTVVWLKSGADWPFFALASSTICDVLPQGGSQCFPLSHLKPEAVESFRAHYADPTISPATSSTTSTPSSITPNTAPATPATSSANSPASPSPPASTPSPPPEPPSPASTSTTNPSNPTPSPKNSPPARPTYLPSASKDEALPR